MAQCVVIDGGGAIVPSASEPCSGFLMLSPSEFLNLSNNPFFLSAEDGALVGAAVVAVWATAYAFRAAISALNVGEVSSQDE